MTDAKFEAHCLTCGGELENRRFHDAWIGNAPVLEDCTEGPYCRACGVVWIAFDKDEDDLKDSVPV